MKIEISTKIPAAIRRSILSTIQRSNAAAPMTARKLRVVPIKKKERSECAGYASMEGDIATLAVNVNIDDLADTIYHECFHIHQMSIGHLVQDYGAFIWKNIRIPIWFYVMFYRMIPFERAAYKFAARMVKNDKRRSDQIA